MKIGITASESKTQYYLNQAYIDYIQEAGMQAFMITKNHDINMIVNMLDGLILPGGIDIDPIYYGHDNYSSYGSDPDKDAFERVVFHAFRKIGKPIFGICRGFQLIIREYLKLKPKLNKFLDFYEDISGHNQINEQQLNRTTCQHFINFFPDLLYGKVTENIVNPTKTMANMPINSMHHQGLIADFGEKYLVRVYGFELIAWTTRGLKFKKGNTEIVCEAFQIVDWGAPILAVQWHPEELKDITLIHNFFLRNNGKLIEKSSKMSKKLGSINA